MNRILTATAVTALLLSGPILRAVHGADPVAASSNRPPAVPLVTSDPYFSIWSDANDLTDIATSHWTGKPQRLTSLVRIDGQKYRLMGDAPADIAAMHQASVTVLPTQTVYAFDGHGVTVTLRFTSPMLPDDLEVLARPTTYLTWTVVSTDGQAHDASIYFDAGAELAVNTPDQNVVESRFPAGDLTALRVGTEDQSMLVVSGDDQRIDWGHLYVATPTAGSTASIAPAAAARAAFAKGDALPADAADKPAAAGQAAVLAFAMPLGSVSAEPVSRHLTLAYDDEFSIKYFHENLRPYWRRNGAGAAELLASAEHDYASLLKRCDAFDAEVVADLTKAGGASYANIGVLAYRQSFAAQKLCADSKGQPLFFSKENFSNGCISTVDVLYPASPQMMVFAPSLLKASLVPLLDYSSSPLWKFDSAPHDLGQYPIAVGQVYGDDAPMPVEESGNMILMLGALSQVEGNAQFAGKYWPTITKWYTYLKSHGLDPTNQLTTDDFAGHIARNSNLSAKAIVAIAAYGKMADMLGKKDIAEEAKQTAHDYAQKWMKLGDAGDHYQLVFGDAGKNTWSQKYNLVWDRLLDLDVFPPEVAQKELAFYKTKMTSFGLPLDSRKDYTKLDWEFWTATLAKDDADFRQYADACSNWANSTSSRVPMTDWYDTKTGKKSGFQARSVVGGVFIGLMRDKAVWSKYASRDTLKPSDWAAFQWKMPPVRQIVPTAEAELGAWHYTTEKPDDKWMGVDFDDAGWKTGNGGFGTKAAGHAVITTKWDSHDIYLRRTFDLTADALNDPQLMIHHDDDAEVYINGVLAARGPQANNSYMSMSLRKSARDALHAGTNVIAVHCRDTGGDQYIDVGLVDLLPMPKP